MTSPRPGNGLGTGVKVGIWVLAIALMAMAGTIAYLLLNRGTDTTVPTPTPTVSSAAPTSDPSEPETTAPPASPDPTPEPTSEPTAEPTEPVPTTDSAPSPAQTLMWQGTATFDHFTVELQEDAGDGPEVPEGKAVLPVEVCLVKALDDSGQARISLDPWSLEDSNGTIQQPQVPGSYEPAFPTDGTYAVGECASGYLTFDLVTDQVDWVNLVYANGLGDRAVWQFH